MFSIRTAIAFAAAAAVAVNAVNIGDQCAVVLDGAPTPFINIWAGSRPCRKRAGTLTSNDVVSVLGKGVRANCQGAGNYMYYKVELDSGVTGWCVP